MAPGTRTGHLAALLAALLLTACSAEDDHRDLACPADQRHGLLLHDDGIPGQYLVKLSDAFREDEVAGVAAGLARAYDGDVFALWATFNAFGLRLPDSRAPALADEAVVCFVEQDSRGVTGAALRRTR